MKRLMSILLMVMLFSAPLFGQNDDSFFDNDIVQTNLFANLPWAAVGLQFAVGGILSADQDFSFQDKLITSSILELSALPLFFYEPQNSFYSAAATSTLLGAEMLSAKRLGLDAHLTGYIQWTRISIAENRAYQSYALTRLNSDSYDNTDFQKLDTMDLYTAPLDFEVLKDPLVLGYAALNALVTFGYQALVSDGFSQSIWETGQAYLGEDPVDLGYYVLANALGFFTYHFSGAVGEESYYRGYLFEEIKYHAGFTVASIVDCSIFTLQHVLTDIARGQDPLYVVLHGAATALITLAWDHLYSRSGLRATVASHAWSNILSAALMLPAYGGGVPKSQRKVSLGI
jgi:membrane protease YdiL (CAAX protease family)